MNRKLHLLLLLLAALTAACTPARREIEGNIARRVRFVGNGGPFSGHNDLQLRSAMQQDNTPLWVVVWPFLYWVDPEALRPEILQRDAYRLEVWYAHNGFFNAQVHGWEMREVRPQTGNKAGIFDIWGYVTPGPPSLVRAYDIRGLPPSLKVLERSVRLEAPLEEGEQFTLDAVEQTRITLLRELLNHSHAYAEVESEIVAVPAEQAVDVGFDVEPGISTVYGPILIEGLDRVDEEDVRAVVPIEPGQSYKVDELALTRQRLFGLSTFSLVTVEPDLSDPTREDVPIQISISESRFQRFRVGGGFEVQAGTIQPRATAQYQHVNLFDDLIRFSLEATGGVALLVGTEAPTLEPTYTFGGTATYPRFIGKKIDLELAGGFEHDVYAGLWVYEQPEADARLVWRPSRNLALRVGPHWEAYEILQLEDIGERQLGRVFGTGTVFVNPYQLWALDQGFTADYRDDPVHTTRGWFVGLTLREAVPVTDNSFAFASAAVEARIFRPIRFSRTASDFPIIFAGKARVGHVEAFNPFGVPYQQLEFLGGPNSIRGFRPRQVGPYDTLCSYATGEVQHFHLPLGGTTSAESTLELRFPWKYGLTFATFGDAGVLERDLTDLGTEDVRWSAGGGVRYETLIGPIRFDVSFRPIYPEDDGPNAFVNCEPGDEEARAFDLFSMFQQDPGDLSNHPPFAMVFYIAIGEAL